MTYRLRYSPLPIKTRRSDPKATPSSSSRALTDGHLPAADSRDTLPLLVRAAFVPPLSELRHHLSSAEQHFMVPPSPISQTPVGLSSNTGRTRPRNYSKPYGLGATQGTMYGLRSKRADTPLFFRRSKRGLVRERKQLCERPHILSSLTFDIEHTQKKRFNTSLMNFEFRITCVTIGGLNQYSYRR